MIADPGRRGRWGLVTAVAVGVLVLDRLTKWWALEALADEPVDVVWTLRLRLTYNTGAAFSFGAGTSWGRWLPLLAIVVVLVVGIGSGAARTRLGAVAVGLVFGGALGNQIDRVVRAEDGFYSGSVVDFVDLQWWPVFNLADAALVVGSILLIGSALLAGEGGPPLENPTDFSVDATDPAATPEAGSAGSGPADPAGDPPAAADGGA